MTSLGKRAAEFIRQNDPFGDHFSVRDLQELAGEPTQLPEQCPVCGGDCAVANPPVMNCPLRSEEDAQPPLKPLLDPVLPGETRREYLARVG